MHYRTKPEEIDAIQLPQETVINNQVVPAGSWLVTKSGGELVIMDDAEFQNLYEPVNSINTTPMRMPGGFINNPVTQGVGGWRPPDELAYQQHKP